MNATKCGVGRVGAVRRNRAVKPKTRESVAQGQISSLPERLDSRPRPTDEEIAGRLRGTNGRLFVQEGGVWRDTETGATGTRAEVEQAWIAE